MKILAWPIIFLFLFGGFWATKLLLSSDTQPDTTNLLTAEVVSVIDGDTVILVLNGQETTVRLIGIDAPESVHPQMPIQCYGREASAYLHGLLPEGTVVTVEKDIEPRDRYDRLLLYIYKENGLFVNEDLVVNGYATASSYPPNTTKQQVFASALKQAKGASVGLWGSCDGPDQPLP